MMKSTENWAGRNATMGDYRPRKRCILVQRQVSSTLIVILLVGTQQIVQMPLAKHNDVIEVFRRIEPMSLSACPLCQGERAEIGLSRMPIVRMRRTNSLP